MGRTWISRFVVGAAFVVLCACSLLAVPKAEAGEICWVTERLTSTAGATAKTFAGAHDSAFYRLPNGIAHDYVFPASGASYAWGVIQFRVTGAAAANADTIRYRIVKQVGGARAYLNLAEQTAASGNTAILPAGMTGLVFEGVLLGAYNTAGTASAPALPGAENSILKVVGDSNGAFNSVEVYLTYPKRCGSR